MKRPSSNGLSSTNQKRVITKLQLAPPPNTSSWPACHANSTSRPLMNAPNPCAKLKPKSFPRKKEPTKKNRARAAAAGEGDVAADAERRAGLSLLQMNAASFPPKQNRLIRHSWPLVHPLSASATTKSVQ